MKRFWLMIALTAFAPVAAGKTQVPSENSLYDHQAEVFSIEGESTILKKGREDWTPVKQGELVQEGDQIHTEAGAGVQIRFDDYCLNFLRIEEKTMAEFRSIEPTDIFLSDGSLFSELEGLMEGAVHTIATPTAVASVRGTCFLRRFDAVMKEDETQVESGKLEITPRGTTGEMQWNRKLDLAAGYQLLFDAKRLQSGEDFKNFSILAMTKKSKARLRFLRRQSQDALMHLMGDKRALHRGRAEWKKMLKNKEKMKNLKERFQQSEQRVPLGERGLDSFSKAIPLTPYTMRSAKESKRLPDSDKEK